jgi:hypothetical protein
MFDTKGVETWQLFDIEEFNEGWHHMRTYVKEAKASNKVLKVLDDLLGNKD